MKKNKKLMLPEIVEGDKLVLPKGMSKKAAINFLLEEEKKDQQVTSFVEAFDTFPWDGAHAFAKAIEKVFGYFHGKTVQGFFRDYPPAMISIATGPNGETKNVPWGRITLPNVEGHIDIGANKKDGRFIFQINAQVKRKYEASIKHLCDEARAYLRNGGSIYQGKAIVVSFSDVDGNKKELEDINDLTPRFMDVSHYDASRLVFPRDLERKIQHYFFTNILHREAAEKLGLPGKRGVLFEGPPGTGKTLTIGVGAKMCVDNGITVVYCENANDFADVVQFARTYAPAMVVCEDIDRVVAGTRTVSIDQVLNIMDGIESKGQKVYIALTSNNVDAIQQPMLRQGRTDLLVRFRAPDSFAVQKLLRMYGGDLISSGENLDLVGRLLDGQIPAAVHEVVNKAKLSALYRSNGNTDNLTINQEDLVLAAESMKEQFELLNKKVEAPLSEGENAAKLLGQTVASGLVTAAKLLVGPRLALKAGNGDIPYEPAQLNPVQPADLT